MIFVLNKWSIPTHICWELACKTCFIRSKLSDRDVGPFQAEISEFVTNFNYRSNINEKYDLFLGT